MLKEIYEVVMETIRLLTWQPKHHSTGQERNCRKRQSQKNKFRDRLL